MDRGLRIPALREVHLSSSFMDVLMNPSLFYHSLEITRLIITTKVTPHVRQTRGRWHTSRQQSNNHDEGDAPRKTDLKPVAHEPTAVTPRKTDPGPVAHEPTAVTQADDEFLNE